MIALEDLHDLREKILREDYARREFRVRELAARIVSQEQRRPGTSERIFVAWPPPRTAVLQPAERRLPQPQARPPRLQIERPDRFDNDQVAQLLIEAQIRAELDRLGF